MNIEQEIKNLKTKYNNDKIEKAKCEGKLEDLEKKRIDIVQRCKDAGIEPDDLPTKIQESKMRLEALIAKANELFGIDEKNGEDEYDDAPF